MGCTIRGRKGSFTQYLCKQQQRILPATLYEYEILTETEEVDFKFESDSLFNFFFLGLFGGTFPSLGLAMF
jgi:hypothetical protein